MDQQNSAIQLEGPVSLLKGAWSFFKSHWKIVVPLVIIPSLVNVIGTTLGFGNTTPLISIIAIVIVIAGSILSVAMAPALIQTVQRLSADTSAKVSLKDQYKIGFGYFWSYLLIALMYSLVSVGSFMFFVIPAIVVGVYIFLYMFTLVVDNKRGLEAFTESYSLVYGRWWPVLGRMLFFGLVSLVIVLILAGLSFLVGLIFGIPGGTSSYQIATSSGESASIGEYSLSNILSLVGTAILVPLGAAYIYRLYLSLKSTRMSGAPTVAFRKWLIAFLVIGILLVLALVIIIPVAIFASR